MLSHLLYSVHILNFSVSHSTTGGLCFSLQFEHALVYHVNDSFFSKSMRLKKRLMNSIFSFETFQHSFLFINTNCICGVQYHTLIYISTGKSKLITILNTSPVYLFECHEARNPCSQGCWYGAASKAASVQI